MNPERINDKQTMKPKHTLSLLFLVFFAFILVSTAAAQEINTETITDDQVNKIAKQLYCPVCENVPLDVCGTQACHQWRELIREKIAQGWGEDEIKEYFVLQYGDRVLAEPPRRGLNWLVYIVPPIAFIVGVFILYRGIQAWRQTTEEKDVEIQIEDKSGEDYIARFEEELRQSDK